ncbi:hypothetical protein HPB50_022160 [Hyalomma asiaticum]|uniref:Uncharacterized protein n=1 Tax=Hyalomma asiaticum TaxID=266040 RepID=A0ACB7RWK7_HYAAI|nr:hypothetical protein HPB50_022160 [Hyalomma asiaticum]
MGWSNVGTCAVLALLVGAIIAANLRERTDAFRMIGAFPRPVTISTSTNDTSFKCLSAVRTHFDLKAKRATYVWRLRDDQGKVKKNVSFDIEEGNEIDQVTYYVDNDRTRPYTAYYNYTDYQNCMIIIVPYNGHDHCMMWVKRAVAHDVPQHCVDRYEENCDVRVTTYDNDLCKDD